LKIGPVMNDVRMRPYSEVNGIIAESAPPGRRKIQKSGVWAPPFTTENLAAVVDVFSEMLLQYPETAGSAVIIQHEHSEKIASVPNNAMAFANRGRYSLMMAEIHSDDPKLDATKLEYARKMVRLMESWGADKVKDQPGSKI
jgi:hypothetical protein